jgi:chemotaxis protein CheX
MISSEDILTITQNVLSTMLNLEAVEMPVSAESEANMAVHGCIQISGEWKGAVVIQSSRDLAEIFAARFFEIDEQELTEADVRDAFAEMTNMIGGNIKGQVPSPSFLSLPAVTTGQQFDSHLVGAHVIRDLETSCHAEPLRILLCEANK